MELVKRLKDSGFSRVIILDGAECGYEDVGSILLALWTYEAETTPVAEDAWIHPYYFASQQAYEAAAAIAADMKESGVSLRDDIRVKPVFSRLPGFSQGRNTLSYVQGYGSRFHVQILTTAERLEPTHHLGEKAHDLHCGSCQACVQACPTKALENGIFHRERCIRQWMMSGKPIPEEIRAHMGNRLIGCDVCQRVCPHNASPEGNTSIPVPLRELLSNPRETAAALRPRIGVNLTIPNRVLSQACLLAGCAQRKDLLPLLLPLADHPSPAVAKHARWAISVLENA